LWKNTDFIDTSFTLKFSLIDTTFKTESYNKIKLLKDFQCSYIGQYKKDKIILLLTYSFRIWAGDGNPIITANVFSEDGKLFDVLRIELESIKDPYYQPTTYITINENLDITTILEVNEFEVKDEKLVLTDSTSIIYKYIINNDGKFIREI
jgi:predicted transcriptional regulator